MRFVGHGFTFTAKDLKLKAGESLANGVTLASAFSGFTGSDSTTCGVLIEQDGTATVYSTLKVTTTGSLVFDGASTVSAGAADQLLAFTCAIFGTYGTGP